MVIVITIVSINSNFEPQTWHFFFAKLNLGNLNLSPIVSQGDVKVWTGSHGFS